MARGPGYNYDNLPTSNNRDAGFRAVEFYDVRTDDVITRFDIKVGANQYTVGFFSSKPQQRCPEIKPTDDLLTPNNGVMNCFNIKADRSQLLAALEELIADLKSDGA